MRFGCLKKSIYYLYTFDDRCTCGIPFFSPSAKQ
jgi:hypothetical protein